MLIKIFQSLSFHIDFHVFWIFFFTKGDNFGDFQFPSQKCKTLSKGVNSRKEFAPREQILSSKS